VHSVKNHESKAQFGLGFNKMATPDSLKIEVGDTSESVKLEPVSPGENRQVSSNSQLDNEAKISSSTAANEAADTSSTSVKFLTYVELLKHVENAAKPYACQVCGKLTDSRRNYLEHYMSHSKERPFKCDICGQGFIRERRMLDHKVIHERSIKKPRLQEICDTTSVDERAYLRSHIDFPYEKKELRPRPDDSTVITLF